MTLAEIRRLYVDERLSTTQIGERANLSPESVRSHLIAMGVQRRDRNLVSGRRLSHDEVDETIDLYRDLGADRAAQVLGIHPWTVRWRVKHAGIALSNRMTTPEPRAGTVTAIEAGELLGLSRNAITHHCRRGHLPGAFREPDWPFRWLIPQEAVAQTPHDAQNTVHSRPRHRSPSRPKGTGSQAPESARKRRAA